MPRTAYATVADLEARLGVAAGTISADAVGNAQATARLADAAAIIRAYVGTTTATAWAVSITDPIVAGDVGGVNAAMVERASRNPAGVVQEQAGPFGRSFGADAAARLYLTALDKSVLRAAAGLSAIGTIAVTRGDIETPTVIAEDWHGEEGPRSDGSYGTGIMADDDPFRFKGEAL